MDVPRGDEVLQVICVYMRHGSKNEMEVEVVYWHLEEVFGAVGNRADKSPQQEPLMQSLANFAPQTMQRRRCRTVGEVG